MGGREIDAIDPGREELIGGVIAVQEVGCMYF